MSVSSYLLQLSSAAVLSSDETRRIKRSIDNLSGRLRESFGTELVDQFRFGSATRQTILPRAYDPSSDIDYMVVFKNSGHAPQTFLDRLRSFAERNYQRSAIRQDRPTMVLELQHIKFDLVPAFKGGFFDFDPYYIPAKAGGWQGTNPNDFNTKLSERNQQCDNLLKPAIRLAKMWNAASGYVYDSFLFEQSIVGYSYWGINNLQDYLFGIINKLDSLEHGTRWRQVSVERAQSIVRNVRLMEQKLRHREAERETGKLFH